MNAKEARERTIRVVQEKNAKEIARMEIERKKAAELAQEDLRRVHVAIDLATSEGKRSVEYNVIRGSADMQWELSKLTAESLRAEEFVVERINMMSDYDLRISW